MQDYRYRLDLESSRPKRRISPLALLILPILVLSATALYAAFAIPIDANLDTDTAPVTQLPVQNSVQLALAPVEAREARPSRVASISKPVTKTRPGSWSIYKVKKGDTLSTIFDKTKLGQPLLYRIINSSKIAKSLTKIRPKTEIKIHLDENGHFDELIYIKDQINSLQIIAKGSSFTAKKHQRDVEHKTKTASGYIQSSLFLDAQKAGLSDNLTMGLAGIFGWDIDFALEIRPGDHFSIVYQEVWLDGKKLRDGPILAAEFVNRGETFRAVRYENKAGDTEYFTPGGKSMRKAFLRTPVKFSRISSRFTKRRWHPVLKKWRSHKGVDYAASRGTPIKASGDGKVIFRGRKGGYGKVVIIKHGQRYTTVYGHMSKFAKKAKQGRRVKQGQIIGYVGSTGLASGPHLHYEFRVNGAHRNPLKVKLPAAAPIPKKYRADFKSQTASLLTQLDTVTDSLVAQLQR